MSLLNLMEPTTSSSLLCPPMNDNNAKEKPGNSNNAAFHFDLSLLQKQPKLPAEFIWPNGDLISCQDELKEPLIDLHGFLNGDEVQTARAAELVRLACLNHGFFQVTNHGVDASLIRSAHDGIDAIFRLPLDKKLGVRRKPGSVYGFSGAHADRFASKLPWKETFSFGYHDNDSEPIVVDYFKNVLGEDFEKTGRVYQKYCEEMKKLSLIIFELLAISLGVDRFHYKKYFEDSRSIMRCNYYPPCNNSSLTLGTGPHSDPTSLTILHQDQVGGLQIFANGKWQAIPPHPHALVVNIGDTFTALSNGRYKSCVHRAVVKREKERRSLVFFVCPKEDKVVRPPQDLTGGLNLSRKYPDFTWSDFLHFTQSHYRADVSTLHSFLHWLLSSKPSHL